MLYDYYVDMTDMNGNSRQNRNSVYQASGSNSVLNILRSRIKACSNRSSWNEDSFDPMNPGCVIHKEQILVNKKIKTIRRVYMSEDNKYKIGWVVDYDIDLCMVCFGGFGWFNLKHHCRSCGLLVCGKCSPYNATIASLNEDGGSRVCRSCHALQAQGIGYGSYLPSNNNSPYPDKTSRHSVASIPVTPVSVPGSAQKHNTPVNTSYGNNSSFNTPQSSAVRRISVGGRVPHTAEHDSAVAKRTNSILLTQEELAKLERQLEPRYREAHEKMRQMIPVDLFKISFNQLLEYGVPKTIADRVWNNKILWLIVMHPDDIAKIHLADFRSKYVPTGLDILEMRAIWYNLPNWVTVSESAMSHSGLDIVDQAKAEWRSGFKARLDDLAYKESRNTLTGNALRNEAYEGYDDLHLFNYEVPLQKRFDTSASYNNQNGVTETDNVTVNSFRYDEGVGGKTKHYLDATTTATRSINNNNHNNKQSEDEGHHHHRRKKASATAVLFNHDSDVESDEISRIPMEQLDLENSSNDSGSYIEDHELGTLSMKNEEYDPLDDIYNYNKPFKPATAHSGHHQQSHHKKHQPEQQHHHRQLPVDDEEEDDLNDEDVLLEETVEDITFEDEDIDDAYEIQRNSEGSQTTRLSMQLLEQQKTIEAQQRIIEENARMVAEFQLQQEMQFQHQQSQALSSNTNRVLSKFYSEHTLVSPQPVLPTHPVLHATSSSPYLGGSVGAGYPQMSTSLTSNGSYMMGGGVASNHPHHMPPARSHSVAYMPTHGAATFVNGSGYNSPMVPTGGRSLPPNAIQSPLDMYGNPIPHAPSPYSAQPYGIRSGHSTPSQFYPTTGGGGIPAAAPHLLHPQNSFSASGSGGHNPYLIPVTNSALTQNSYYGSNPSLHQSPVPPPHHSTHTVHNSSSYNPGEITPPRSSATVVRRATTVGVVGGSASGQTSHNSSAQDLNHHHNTTSATLRNIQAINTHVNNSFVGHPNLHHSPPHANSGDDIISIAEKQLTPRSCLSVTSEADENTLNSNPAEVPQAAAPSVVSTTSSLSGTVSVHSTSIANIIQVNSPLTNDHLTVHHLASPKQNTTNKKSLTIKPAAASNAVMTTTATTSVSQVSADKTKNGSLSHLQVIQAVTPMSTSSTSSSDVNAGASTTAGTVTKSPPRKKLVHNNSVNSITTSNNNNNNNSKAPSVAASVASTSNNNNNNNSSSPVPKKYSREELKEKLVNGITSGHMSQVNNALKLVYKDSTENPQNTVNSLVDSAEASQLLLYCFETGTLSQPIELLHVLVDTLFANINVQHSVTGATVLHYAIEQENRQLCAVMLKKGSNILLNNFSGVSPLAASLNQTVDWLLVEFEACGKEEEFIQHSNQFVLFQYATTLILSGYAMRASKVIQSGRVVITSDDATELLNNCNGNFEQMKEPVETFELLDSLGAKS